MNIIVAYATPKEHIEIPLIVPQHCTVALAIKRSGILKQCREISFPDIDVGIYSKKVKLDMPLRDGDRVEIYRPLMIDPKQARRSRAQE